ncbi:imelysin family protein [Bizionia saleffrena]|uniref:Imelysin family protein n=1 Tax=Bizionia saleffrena TaxID=291189 RepID=A0A8H2LFK2_9FLAO|nr:imelysin family protein [Bizionia saleffrena]TYB80115.1 imelysin family protein [Bizionia saleffrena]
MIKKGISILVLALVIVGCSTSDDSNTNGGASDNFDRQAMLTHWGDNFIIPVLEDVNIELEALVQAKNTFVTTPNQANLVSLRTAWLSAYKVWQYAEMFNIGKADELAYFKQMNIYPSNVTLIESNISNGSYDLGNSGNNAAVGFPALDYLLFGVATTDTDIVAIYSTSVNASNYTAYLSDVVEKMKTLTQTVVTSWNSGYRNDYISRSGNSATSGVNETVNDYINYYERGLRSLKFGIPAGVFANSPLPEKVEGYYSKIYSKELAAEALNAVQEFFIGEAYNSTVTGPSLKAYLGYLNKTDISSSIVTQYDQARTRMQVLNPNFNQQIQDDSSKMTQVYDALQVGVVLLKVDMIQAMQISLDQGYVDNDGD